MNHKTQLAGLICMTVGTAIWAAGSQIEGGLSEWPTIIASCANLVGVALGGQQALATRTGKRKVADDLDLAKSQAELGGLRSTRCPDRIAELERKLTACGGMSGVVTRSTGVTSEDAGAK